MANQPIHSLRVHVHVQVLNGAEVIQALEDVWGRGQVDVLHHFEELASKSANWSDAMALLRDAAVIVSPHGGSMSNMVFAPAKTAVVEFIPLLVPKSIKMKTRPCFLGLSHALGFEYHAVAPVGYNKTFFDHGAMTVPISELKATVGAIKQARGRIR